MASIEYDFRKDEKAEGKMAEHTSTPWRFASHNIGTYSILAEEGPITVCPAIPTGYADGTFIVRACNAHDDLVVALTVCLEAIDEAHKDPEAGLPSPAWHWWKAARAALSRARGEV